MYQRKYQRKIQTCIHHWNNGGGPADAAVDVDAARANVIGFKPLLLLLLLLLLLFMIDDTDTDTDTLLYFTAVPCE